MSIIDYWFWFSVVLMVAIVALEIFAWHRRLGGSDDDTKK